MNGIYDAVCAIVLFPAIVWLAASGRTTDRITARVCKFLGDISYPLYMVHYPFIYLYYAWVKNEELTFAESLPGAAALVAGHDPCALKMFEAVLTGHHVTAVERRHQFAQLILPLAAGFQ